MGKKKIVLDTNVLISALGWSGNSREIISKVIDKELDLVMSKSQLEELKRVLDYKKFSFTEDQKSTFLSIILEIADIVEIKGELNLIKEDPDDNRILESAVDNNVEFIVSGDEHLLKLKEYDNIKIVNPATFLELIKSGQ